LTCTSFGKRRKLIRVFRDPDEALRWVISGEQASFEATS
jgi:hypothetical protein